MASGALVIAVAVGLGISGAWLEHRDRTRFTEALEDAPAAPSSAPGSRSETDALGVLRVDRLDWSVIVRPTSSAPDLAKGAGWIVGTALPGSPGNTGIAGHRDTFFRALRHFKINDEITLVTDKGTVRYVVRELLIVDPDRIGVIAPDRRTSLTLVTCYPFRFVGRAPRRFVVKAYEKPISRGRHVVQSPRSRSRFPRPIASFR